jgi:hypothetical protein
MKRRRNQESCEMMLAKKCLTKKNESVSIKKVALRKQMFFEN